MATTAQLVANRANAAKRHVEKLATDRGKAAKSANRLARWRPKLFTFLDHDGVLWNNNSENSVTRFASRRKVMISVVRTPARRASHLWQGRRPCGSGRRRLARGSHRGRMEDRPDRCGIG